MGIGELLTALLCFGFAPALLVAYCILGCRFNWRFRENLELIGELTIVAGTLLFLVFLFVGQIPSAAVGLIVIVLGMVIDLWEKGLAQDLRQVATFVFGVLKGIILWTIVFVWILVLSFLFEWEYYPPNRGVTRGS
jgi:hypothetical protein